MGDLIPIQTRYAGRHFRSRLEARWAVFLSEMKFDWKYEFEGYETSIGKYLPDFEIFGGRVHLVVEVKPVFPSDDEIQKMCDVVNSLWASDIYGDDVRGIFLVGDPGANDPVVVHYADAEPVHVKDGLEACKVVKDVNNHDKLIKYGEPYGLRGYYKTLFDWAKKSGSTRGYTYLEAGRAVRSALSTRFKD